MIMLIKSSLSLSLSLRTYRTLSAAMHAPPQNHRRGFSSAKCSLESPDLSRLAQTARISLTPAEVEEFSPKIQQVVDWFGQLQNVDLQSIEPAIRADTEGSNWRDDVPETFENREAIVAAVPNYEDSYIKVPNALNKE